MSSLFFEPPVRAPQGATLDSHVLVKRINTDIIAAAKKFSTLPGANTEYLTGVIAAADVCIHNIQSTIATADNKHQGPA